MAGLTFGREVTGDFELATGREWLVTNGLGGWASGTVSGANSRRYHGLFVPALQPPLGRTVLLSQVNEVAIVDGRPFALSTNEYGDGTVDPHGYRHIQAFRLDGLIPTWEFALADILLVKRVWMPHLHDTTCVAYTCSRAVRPRLITLDVLAMLSCRDAHGQTMGGAWAPEVTPTARGASVRCAGVTFHLIGSPGRFEAVGQWHWNIRHRVEAQRGLADREDQFAAGSFHVRLSPGETFVLVATLEEAEPLDWEASLAAERARAAQLIAQAGVQSEPAWIKQLALAADQFIVRRGAGHTVIAGYHWFGDWGRDTMIALPGLTLATGRHEIAADILRTFASYVDRGMLPNRFPDQGDRPEYNTVDATLWFVHAVDRYLQASGDERLVRALWPTLEDILGWHLRGTRYRIRVDAEDGLLSAGEAGVQLTWMDAKVGDWVVTPRMGKPVEINALWVNALRVMEALSARLRLAPAHAYGDLARRAAASFDKFWYADGGYLYDVIEGAEGNDPALRPNQLLAIALPHGPLGDAEHRARARAVVEACAAKLLTSRGLRSLSPEAAAYTGTYAGNQARRDAAYHQGTVWAWLIGPFVDAYVRAYEDAQAARTFLDAFEPHVSEYGLGSVAEIFEGAAPFAPRGCVAQAWSVAELLRAWRHLGEA